MINTEIHASNWAELTQYPKIYSRVYWGWYNIMRDRLNLPDEGIVHNRNRFIDDYKIITNKFKYGCSSNAYKEFQKKISGEWAANIEYKEMQKKHGKRSKELILYKLAQMDVYRDNWTDHREYYTTSSGDSICICSQHSSHDASAEKAGFTKIYPLYSVSTTTWIMVIPRVI
jgi:hypothetical protein